MIPDKDYHRYTQDTNETRHASGSVGGMGDIDGMHDITLVAFKTN